MSPKAVLISGYSGTPLIRKLGLKPGMRVRLHEPPDGYWALLGGEPSALGVMLLPAVAAGGGTDDAEPCDFSHLFATTAHGLADAFAAARAGMAEEGLVWASWPKKSSGVAAEIGRAEVMAAGQAVGLVDVKVCAVDEIWSGLKFVIPVAERRG